jgi:hypothetical protein
MLQSGSKLPSVGATRKKKNITEQQALLCGNLILKMVWYTKKRAQSNYNVKYT